MKISAFGKCLEQCPSLIVWSKLKWWWSHWRGFAFRSTEFLKRNLDPTGLEYGRRRRVAGSRWKLFCMSFVRWRVCLTVSWFRTSHRLFKEQMDWLTAHLLTAHEDRDVEDEELFLHLTCGVEDAATCLSAPHFSLPWSAGWRGLCSTCSTARLSQIASCSSFLSFCAVREEGLPRTSERPLRRGLGARSPTPRQLRPGSLPAYKDFNTLRPSLAQEKQDLSFSLSWPNHSCFPLVAMLQNRLGTRAKTSKTRVFCVVAVYLPLYQAVTFPKMIDGLSLRSRFDRPFVRLFRNQFSELEPRSQHSVQKIP